MSIHIVSHCYAVRLPQYAQQLCCQLSSLVQHTPTVPTRITICLTYSDHRTIEVINWFRDNCPALNLHTLTLPDGSLFRRSIGRNLACVDAREELTWFTDVDHVFGHNCLDTLWSTWIHAQMHYRNVTMLYPKQIMIHKDHATGDASMEQITTPKLVNLDLRSFEIKNYNRAIGGIQIVPRWYIRQYGYLADNAKYQQDVEKPFADFRDDVVFRGDCQKRGRILPITLPNLFRIRHSKTTYQGQDHATVNTLDSSADTTF